MNDKELNEAAEESFRRFMLVSEGVTGMNLEKMIRESSLSQEEAQAILDIIKINYRAGFKAGYMTAT